MTMKKIPRKKRSLVHKHISVRQQAAADLILKNQMLPADERMNKTEIAEAAGFKSPAALHSAGVNLALQKYGLTFDLVTSSLVNDIKDKPGKRLGELTLAADILGMRRHKDDGGGNKTLVVMISGQSADRYGIDINHGPR